MSDLVPLSVDSVDAASNVFSGQRTLTTGCLVMSDVAEGNKESSGINGASHGGWPRCHWGRKSGRGGRIGKREGRESNEQ